jgi:hypothetical protein
VEAHDLAASKLVAFRDKDREFVRILLAHGLIKARTLRLRIGQLPRNDRVPEELRTRMLQWLSGTLRDLGRAT